MAYIASQRWKLVVKGEEDSTLVTHERRADGGSLCGIVHPRSWEGKEMVFADFGPGEVTCGSCARVAQGELGDSGFVTETVEERNRRLPELTHEQRERVAARAAERRRGRKR